jgi:hypothetical protein
VKLEAPKRLRTADPVCLRYTRGITSPE